MCRFSLVSDPALTKGLSNAEVDPVREAGLGGGSLATGLEYESGPGECRGRF
jgi:hypothetical protein